MLDGITKPFGRLWCFHFISQHKSIHASAAYPVWGSSFWVCPGSPPHRYAQCTSPRVSPRCTLVICNSISAASFRCVALTLERLTLSPLGRMRSHRKREAHSLQLHSFSHYAELVEVSGGWHSHYTYIHTWLRFMGWGIINHWIRSRKGSWFSQT